MTHRERKHKENRRLWNTYHRVNRVFLSHTAPMAVAKNPVIFSIVRKINEKIIEHIMKNPVGVTLPKETVIYASYKKNFHKHKGGNIRTKPLVKYSLSRFKNIENSKDNINNKKIKLNIFSNNLALSKYNFILYQNFINKYEHIVNKDMLINDEVFNIEY